MPSAENAANRYGRVLARRVLLVVLVFLGASGMACAQDYPTWPVRAVAPFAPAGVMDVVARIVLERVGQSLGQQIVIDNRPGAGGTIAVDAVAHAAPDGYTIVIADPAGSLAASVSLYPKLNFDPVRDLAPIALVGTSGAVLSVTNSLPTCTLEEFDTLAKSRPASAFAAGIDADTSTRVGQAARRRRGCPCSIPLLAGGHRSDRGPNLVLDFADRDRAAAVAVRPVARARGAGQTRSRDLPDVPTVKERGFGDYDVSTSYALFAPAGTPREIVEKLAAETKRALATDSVHERLRTAGIEPRFGSEEEVRRLLVARIAQWSDVIKMSGIETR